jgi:lipopolysaccharide transport system ATP-binding protein
MVARFEFRLPVLPSGDYSISPAFAECTQEEHIQHHLLHDALLIKVHASSVCLWLNSVPMRQIPLESH